MTTVAQMAPNVRVALAVSAEYEGSTIPDVIRRVMRRLLRDYNFPKSIKRWTGSLSALGTVSYTLPAGVKRPLEFRFQNPSDGTWSKRLERREGFAMPYGTDGYPNPDDELYGRRYWLEGMALVVDTPMPVSNVLTPVLWYQSMLLDAAAETWMLDDMEDLIFSRSVMQAALQLRKTEAAQSFASLVAEETQSIAIYANEIEWNGVEVQMREPRALPSARYPAGPVVGG